MKIPQQVSKLLMSIIDAAPCTCFLGFGTGMSALAFYCAHLIFS